MRAYQWTHVSLTSLLRVCGCLSNRGTSICVDCPHMILIFCVHEGRRWTVEFGQWCSANAIVHTPQERRWQCWH